MIPSIRFKYLLRIPSNNKKQYKNKQTCFSVCQVRCTHKGGGGGGILKVVVVLLGNPVGYIGLVTGNPRYFCKYHLNECREDRRGDSDGRGFQRKEPVKSREIVQMPERQSHYLLLILLVYQ